MSERVAGRRLSKADDTCRTKSLEASPSSHLPPMAPRDFVRQVSGSEKNSACEKSGKFQLF